MAERTTVRLPDDLIRRAKHRAAAEGRTLTALIEDGLRQVLSERAPGRKVKRVMPPVSRATGGLKPGISLDDMASLQEMEDLDYAGRLR
jgi:hypothetical protein